MSAEENYFNIPLSVLHRGTSILDALLAGISCGILNAGIGHRKTYDAATFGKLLQEARQYAQEDDHSIECPPNIPLDLWEAALVGAKTLGASSGFCTTAVSNYQKHQDAGGVFFRIRRDWMWNAYDCARKDDGHSVTHDHKPLSWREFRILAAILSAPVNKQDFTFLGWETIQARACGFHSKALLKAGAATLPAHCQPLSRRNLRQELEKMEALGFFLRCRYSSGKRGGLMAYSFRHLNRYDLTDSITEWREDNLSFQTQAAENRTADLAYFAMQPLIRAFVKDPNDETASRNLMAARKALPAKSMMSPNSDVF